nr:MULTISPECIES: NAD(P)-binding domain-containing protein [unclassified Nocardiopsis]
MTNTRNTTERVAVIGTGSLGGVVARRLLSDGHDVTVWNRTRGRAEALADAGARTAGSAAEALSSAALVPLTLTDHAAARQVPSEADADLSGRTVAVLGTGTPDGARRTAERVEAAGARYLNAGVQAAPETIGTEAANLLYSGSRSAFERHRETLGALGRSRFVGEAPRRPRSGTSPSSASGTTPSSACCAPWTRCGRPGWASPSSPARRPTSSATWSPGFPPPSPSC